MQFKDYAFAKQTKNQKGMTLLEILIALGIIGFVAAGAIALAQIALESQNMNTLVQSLNTLRFAGIQTYRTAGRYPAWDANNPNRTTFALIRLGKAADKDGINPFNNDMIPFVTFGKNSGDDRKAFALAMENLSQDECKSLVTKSAHMFSYIAIEKGTNANYRDTPYEKAIANAANSIGVIKSEAPGSINLDLSNMTHAANLCGGSSDEARQSAYTVYLGSI